MTKIQLQVKIRKPGKIQSSFETQPAKTFKIRKNHLGKLEKVR
jgi:hypothetical protein